MRILVTVTPGAREPRVEEMAGGRLRVAVAAPAREGKANAALIELLARHFGVARSRIRIVKGGSSRHKFVEVG